MTMYVPKHFAETDVEKLHALMRAHGFATLVSVIDGAPFATHVPLILDAERGEFGTIVGHVAKANPHWHAFDGQSSALAIFQGPHAYVSPRWYASSPRVPSWNYEAVHAIGVPRVVDDAEQARAILARSAAIYESGAKEPWTVAAQPESYIAGAQRAIVAFELPIARLEGKRKLSQNVSPADRAGVAAGLRASGDPSGVAIAAAMEAIP